jgi:hypothetical protein
MGAAHLDTYRAPSSAEVGSTFRVGAASRDITPPPGSSLAGHGPGARVAIGHWTRLYCRAFYIEPDVSFTQTGASPLAVVACELPQMSTLLVRRTIEVLRERVEKENIEGSLGELEATRLMVAAIHTHAGQGHIFDAKNMSGFASSHFPGHDPKMVDFIAERLADALVEAHQKRRPAELRWVERRVFGFARNSALTQFLLNCPLPKIPNCEDEEGKDHCQSLGREDRNIDSRLRLLEFRDKERETMIGALAFYALHPTFIGNQNRHYGGDIFGIVTRMMERELVRELSMECEGRPDSTECKRNEPVFAFFNTNEADAQPRRVSGTQREVIRNGELFTQAIWDSHCLGDEKSKLCSQEPTRAQIRREEQLINLPLLDANHPLDYSWHDRPIIRSRYADVHLPGESVARPSDPKTRAELAKVGTMGISATKGSLANPTAMLFLTPTTIETFRYQEKPIKNRQKELQNPKRKFPFSGGGFAKVVPLSLVQLGDTYLSFVPAEITIAVGEKINQGVLQGAAGGRDAVIVGLSNGYVSYMTSEQEFDLQAYHGGSTVYGRETADFFAYSFECLARNLTRNHESCEVPGEKGKAIIGAATTFHYNPGPHRARLWREGWDKQTRGREEPGEDDACALVNTKPPVVCFHWQDEGPHSVLSRPEWLVRAVSSDAQPLFINTPPFQGGYGQSPPDDAAPSSIDDRGYAFTTQVLFRKNRVWHWSTVFRPSPEVWDELKEFPDYRLEINRGPGRDPIRSPKLRDIGACTAEMINTYCPEGH